MQAADWTKLEGIVKDQVEAAINDLVPGIVNAEVLARKFPITDPLHPKDTETTVATAIMRGAGYSALAAQRAALSRADVLAAVRKVPAGASADVIADAIVAELADKLGGAQ